MKIITKEQFSELYQSGCKYFKDIDLRNINLSNYDLSNCEFKNSCLFNVNFSNANMTNTNFIHCNLGYANFTKAYSLKDNVKFKYRPLRGVC